MLRDLKFVKTAECSYYETEYYFKYNNTLTLKNMKDTIKHIHFTEDELNEIKAYYFTMPFILNDGNSIYCNFHVVIITTLLYSDIKLTRIFLT
jgi:hypothetical protein